MLSEAAGGAVLAAMSQVTAVAGTQAAATLSCLRHLPVRLTERA